jgi:hypothetical protein
VTTSRWHRIYSAEISAPAATLFELISDLPNYGRWLPSSSAYQATTEVEPYPVAVGTRYHDGRPAENGKDWWGTVTGFRAPGSIDFEHNIRVPQLLASVDAHIHYSIEPSGERTQVYRWLVLDVRMPLILRPFRAAIILAFHRENLRTMAALKAFAESKP